jgi:hypothetical protein
MLVADVAAVESRGNNANDRRIMSMEHERAHAAG